MLGKNGDEPFNIVRRRANMPVLTNVTLQQLKDERRMELVCEWGDSYTDLRHWGDCETELKHLEWTKGGEYFPVPFSQYTATPDLRLDPLSE